MKKTKKALASLAIAGMVLSMAPVSVFAADEDTRLAGADRYLTSIKIAEKAYASADTAVVAAGNPNNLVDALAAAPLAAQEDAPIYLTDKADMNDDVVKSMKALGVDKVIVVGAAASKAVVDELKAAGFTVEEVKGAGRVETAEAINAKLTAPAGTFVVGYDGVADAMSVASYAAANNYAIVVTNQNGMANGTVEADYIVGGTTRVKDIAGAKRLAGADRYDTNKQVIAELDFDFGTVYVGNGLTLADALVGSVLAAQTDSPIALTDGKTVKADIASNLDADSVIVALGGTAAVSNAVIDAVKNPPSTGEFKVDTVSAIAADAFAVNFTKAPADASKITFEVKQGTAPVTVSATWDGAKAALKKSSKFVAGTYTVVVKEGEKELANKEVTVTEQKIAKIEITSNKLGVVTKDAVQTGYATYKVLDQYGVDITNSALANSIEFITGVGTANAKKGLLTIEPTGVNLLTYTSGIVITANDRNSGASTSATLAVTSQVGTLTDITLNKLTNADGKELTAGSTVDVFYIDYTATDISGNPTNNYELIVNGLIGKDELTVSNPDYVKATVVHDPKDSTKALIKVVTTEKTIDYETPLMITAMTWTGKTSQLNVDLKRQAAVATITLLAPEESVASGEEGTIPFLAYDQNGNALTKYSDLNDDTVKLSGANWKKNLDGTASIKSEKVIVTGNTSVPKVITASVNKTGKFSSITINIQKPVKADTLNLDEKVIKSLMQEASGSEVAATQKIDFGYDKGGLAVKDQYGRDIDMVTAGDEDTAKYEVKAKTSDAAVVKFADGKNVAKAGQSQIQLQALKAGSATVTFELYEGSTLVDTKSQTITVVQDKDIKDYAIDAVESAIYAVNGLTGYTVGSKQVEAFNANPKVWGLTSGGGKVVLRGTPVISAKVNSPYFEVISGDNGAAAYDKVKVVANKLDASMTEATAELSVTIREADGDVFSQTTAIKSSKVPPVAQTIEFEYDTSIAGITFDDDIVTIDGNAALAESGLAVGQSLSKYIKGSGAESDSSIFFSAKDQYGKKGMNFDSISFVDDEGTGFKVDSTGVITAMPTKAGTVKVTAVVSGKVKPVGIEFKNISGTPVVNKDTLKAAITDAQEAFDAAVVGTEPGQYPQAAKDAFEDAIEAAQAVVDDEDADAAAVAAAVTALEAAKTTFEDAVNVELGENEIAGTIEPTVFGDALAFTVSDGTKVTKVTKNGTELTTAAYDYAVDGDTVRVSDIKAGDVVKVTVDSVEYTVIF